MRPYFDNSFNNFNCTKSNFRYSRTCHFFLEIKIKCPFKFCKRYNSSIIPYFANSVSQMRCYMIYASVLLVFVSINVYLLTYCVKWLDYH